jgi:[3-methyl-2-oxobutanoate dehydrogenase (acetyl-transferring)] kinase
LRTKYILIENFFCVLIRKVCRAEYGIAPDIKIDGHVDSSFPYITTPLNYIVPEMLKNAFR